MSLAAYTAKFLKSHGVTAGWEGGWSNDPADPGGKTMYGITEGRFHEWLDKHGLKRRPVRTITKDQALAIFFEGYWKGSVNCEQLVPGVDLAVYDASVMSGPARGRKWLLASLDKQNRHDQTVKNICARRLSFVEGLKHFRRFGRGWSRRIADVQAKGVAWALLNTTEAPVVAQQLQDEAADKKAASTKQNSAGAGSATVGGGSFAADQATQSTQLADWLLTGVGLFFIAAALFLIWRAFLNRQQANAFAAQAEVI